MPYKEREIKKEYYTIGEVARMFEVAPSLIRFWETEFEDLSPRKNRKGNRLYTPQDIETFRTIYHLVKERGYTIPGARDLMRQRGPQLKERMEVAHSLEKVRGFLVELRKQLDGLGKNPTSASPSNPLSEKEMGD
ncbi:MULTISPECIES: MerR family transcriptional regulator [Hymenobacter]|uniref:MerR family transcriptional regulator n=2 Tax=Hymenobacter TaxID=89966 RepID=A0ABS6X2I3_9BACT|nr:MULTISPECIES: MerR family transcriptional regulator [Hymenobacter]MBO3269782.1 MerR family transcriptional regulator [Hymenobacter defluvii]MBW3130041.1 MerR family transcriptional regulator [Hymenobacter profundi]QNE39433.1 MerR family transcriptional regulator [Hymenobacter sp. NBH84]